MVAGDGGVEGGNGQVGGMMEDTGAVCMFVISAVAAEMCENRDFHSTERTSQHSLSGTW